MAELDMELFKYICVAFTVVFLTFTIIQKYSQTKQKEDAAFDFDVNEYECRLMIDHDQKLFHEWLDWETPQIVLWTVGKCPVTWKGLQEAPWTMYPQRFPSPDDTENVFHFRAGKYLNADRFDAVLMPKSSMKQSPITFGHIECVFVWSHRLNMKVAWLYDVYIAQQFRRKSLGISMLQKALKYCYEDKRIEQVHLIVFADNKPAHRLYEKLNFKQYTEAYDKEHDHTFIVMKHTRA